jgi:hypothetical protein
MGIVIAPDSNAIVLDLRARMAKLGIIREQENRNSHIAEAFSQCVVMKREDLQKLFAENAKWLMKNESGIWERYKEFL